MRAHFMSNSFALDLEAGRGMTEGMVAQLAFLEALASLAAHYEHQQPPLPANIRVEVRKAGWDLDVRLHCEWGEEAAGE